MVTVMCAQTPFRLQGNRTCTRQSAHGERQQRSGSGRDGVTQPCRSRGDARGGGPSRSDPGPLDRIWTPRG